jgi:uncharacterized protein (TIGR03083 family)
MEERSVTSSAALLARIQDGWHEFSAYLMTLTREQLTVPTDAAGWTIKDHLIHVAVWEGSICALLQGQSGPEYTGVAADTWRNADIDAINALLHERYRSRSVEEALRMLQDTHQRLVEKIQSLTEDDLLRACRGFQPGPPSENAVIDLIISNTCDHYAEHQPWLAAIAESL